jgi:hypothetical protein
MLSHFGLASRGSDESSYARADTQPRARLTETGPGAELEGSCVSCLSGSRYARDVVAPLSMSTRSAVRSPF